MEFIVIASLRRSIGITNNFLISLYVSALRRAQDIAPSDYESDGLWLVLVVS